MKVCIMFTSNIPTHGQDRDMQYSVGLPMNSVYNVY